MGNFKDNKSAIVGLATLTASYAVFGVSLAEAQAAPEWSANVELLSDYRLRGVSLSNKKPVLQGEIGVAIGNFYAGAWTSNVSPSFIGANVEVGGFAGYVLDIEEKISFDLGAMQTTYAGGLGSELDFYELALVTTFATGPVSWRAEASYAPEQTSLLDQDNTYFNLGTEFVVANGKLEGLKWGASFGWEDGIFGDEKLDLSVGVSRTFEPVSLGLAYVDTNKAFDEASQGAVLSIGYSF